MMQNEIALLNRRVLIQMIDSISTEQRSPALDAMNLVALVDQEFRKIRTILTCNASDQSLFSWSVHFCGSVSKRV